MNEAKDRYQVNGTPAIVVNGKLTTSPSYAEVAKAINEAMPK